MTTEEAIHRAALRKHRHKGNYIATHEALLANVLGQECERIIGLIEPELQKPQPRSPWQIIKGWFA